MSSRTPLCGVLVRAAGQYLLRGGARSLVFLIAVAIVAGVPSTVAAQTAAPTVSGVSPSILVRSGRIRLTGSGFGAQQGTSTVRIGGAPALISRWSDGSITAYVPETSVRGGTTVQVTTAAGSSNAVAVTVEDRPAGGQVRWRFMADARSIQSRPAVGPDGTVYAVDADGLVYALTGTGALKWVYRAPAAALYIQPVALGADGTIYVAGGATITALRPDGTPKWAFTEPSFRRIFAGPSVGPDGNIYAVSEDGNAGGLGAFALSPTKVLLWKHPGFSTRAGYGGIEIVFGGTGQLFFTTNSSGAVLGAGGLYSFLRDGRFLWAVPAVGQPRVTAGLIVTGDGNPVHPGVVAYDVAGTRVWRALGEGSGTDAQTAIDIADDGTAYAGTLTQTVGRHLTSVDIQGAVRWQYAGTNTASAPAVHPNDNSIVIGGYEMDKAGAVHSVNSSGIGEWRVQLPMENGGYVRTAAMPRFSPDGAVVYVGTSVQGSADAYSYLYAIGTVHDGSNPPNEPPRVTVASPADGAVITSTPFVIAAPAFDPDGMPLRDVRLYVEHASGMRELVGTDTEAPFQAWTPMLGLGTYKVFAVATDSLGAAVQSRVHTITVSTASSINNAPVAYDQTVTVGSGAATPIDLTAADSDSDPLAFTIVAAPAHGVVTGSAPSVVYTPAAGYAGPDAFSFKVNDGTADSNVATVTLTVSAGTFSLGVATTGSGAGLVTAAPAGISCPGDCASSYPSGAEITLTATPAAGSSFAGWSGDCTGTAVCKIVMDRARAVTAGFVRSGRDLVQSAPSAPPARTAPRGRFDITESVVNQGDALAGMSVTRYYLSRDAIRSAGDLLLTGSRSVPELAPGASSTGTRTVTVPASTPLGTYTVLACSDDLAKVAETNETNNCAPSAGTLIVALPDLVTNAVGPLQATAVPGGKLTVTDTIANVGNGDAASSTVRYYLSADAVKGPGDVLLDGTRAVVALAQGATSSGSRAVAVPHDAPLAAYRVLACADDLLKVAESNEANNCSASTATVVIGWPDLAMAAISSPPTAAAAGNRFAIYDTVQNQGNVSSPSATTRYYLTLNGSRDAGDVLLIGVRGVPALAAGATSSGSRTVTVPDATPAGTYYLLGCADDLFKVGELNESNNCAVSAAAVVINP